MRGRPGALLVWFGALVIALSAAATGSPVSAQQRHVGVVGHSIVLGAEGGSPSGLDGIRVLGLTLGAAVLLVLAALVGTGVVLGSWALASAGRRTRSRDVGDGDVGDRASKPQT